MSRDLKKMDYYNQGEIEAIDLINDWGLNFNLGSIVKYISRCKYKHNKKEDLKKAINYVDYEIKYKTNRSSTFINMSYKPKEIIKDWELDENILGETIVMIYTYVMSGNESMLYILKNQLIECTNEDSDN